MDYKGKKFIASISGGKDSSQSVYAALQMGMEPIFFFTTYDKAKDRNYFHGISREMLDAMSKVTKVPIHIVLTDPKNYGFDFVTMLKKGVAMGAQFCVFGDIDIEEHRKWGEDCCERAGISGLYPLWQIPREEVVKNFVKAGFKSVITVVDELKLSADFLGRTLDTKCLEDMRNVGVDICGERGEFHTFTYFAPYFSDEIPFTLSETQVFENYRFKILELKNNHWVTSF